MKHFYLIFLPIFLVTQNTQARIPTKSSPKKEFSISPEDEIRDLLTDEKKYRKNKDGCAVAAVGCIGIAFCTVAIGKDIKYAVLPVMGMLSTASFSLWNWWAEARSYRQAHALADQHGYEVKSHDDSQRLEHINQGTQTED